MVNDMIKVLNRIELCRFKKDSGSSWEVGLLLNEGELGILDGKIVPEVWTWRRLSDFALNIGSIMEGYINNVLKNLRGE
jgi:hypothetical protein